MTHDIAPFIPYLRRFARALTGSQRSGDDAVSAAIEAMVAQPRLLRSDLSSQVALYRAFLESWQQRDIDPVTGGRGADKSLGRMSPISRQAFLLMSMEGFSHRDTAIILGIAEEGIDGLITDVGREIANLVATNVLIIEDEPLIAIDLSELVKKLGHHITSVARTHREAVVAAAAKRPGLILADIQLADGSSGLNAVNEILTAFDAPVVFITAYPERLLTGDRPEPAFVITKPFDEGMVQAVICQALFFDTKAKTAHALGDGH